MKCLLYLMIVLFEAYPLQKTYYSDGETISVIQ